MRAATSKPRLPPRAVVHSALHIHSPPAVAECTTALHARPAQLVAALSARTALPRAPNSRMRAVTRRLHIAPAGLDVGRGNRRATAGEREFGALTPVGRCSRPSKSDNATRRNQR